MKILNIRQFIDEKIKVMPISNGELNKVKEFDSNKKDAKKYLMNFLDKDFIDRFDLIRTLRTGNIELISNSAKYANHTGVKCVLYLESSPICWRRWNPAYMFDNPINRQNIQWETHSIKMGEFSSVKDLMDSFKTWIDKKVTFVK